MIEYLIDYDIACWVRLPRSFPLGGVPNENAWVELQLREFAAANGELSSEDREAGAQLARLCLEGVSPASVEAFWFCPRAAPTSGVVNIQVQEIPPGVDPSLAEIFGSASASLPPVVETLETAALGPGVVVRRVVDIDRPGDRADVIGQVTFVFNPPGYLIIVDAIAMDLSVIGAMTPALLALVDAISLVDGASIS
ncbi:hypothetical protein [Luethyella okanaganae]|uniref:Uncharacterized protein n=1 Tax=Luethyella okanaganae TaxID=69372 RepID=A0ABW1VCH4_9MICO